MTRLFRAIVPVGLGLALVACSSTTSSTAKVDAPPQAKVEPQAAAVDPVTGSARPTPPDRSKLPLSKRSPIAHPLREARPLEVLKTLPTYQFNEAELDAYLKHLHATEPDPIKRLVHLARKNIGQPYDIYLLGEFPYETYDPDPMYCLEKSDCVTNVEHMYAEALGKDWPTFFKTLQRLRYKDGKVGMLTRNHETVADWDKNNAWLFEDPTKSLGDGKQWLPLRMTWRPSKFFAKFGIGQDLPDVPINDAFIPVANITTILPDLKEGDVVHIVRGNPETQQWVGHVGLVVFGEGGSVNFLHSAEPAVREQPLMDYVTKSKTTIGIKILRPKANPQQLADAAIK